MNQPIIDLWLSLSAWQIFLSLVAFYLTTALLIHWFCFRSPWHQNVHNFRGIVAPFMVAPGFIFALMLSFLAGDVWA